MVWLPDGEKFGNVFTRFDTIHDTTWSFMDRLMLAFAVIAAGCL